MLLVRAEEGQLAWSRPDMEGTASVPTSAEEFTGFLFPGYVEGEEEPEGDTRVFADD